MYMRRNCYVFLPLRNIFSYIVVCEFPHHHRYSCHGEGPFVLCLSDDRKSEKKIKFEFFIRASSNMGSYCVFLFHCILGYRYATDFINSTE